MIFFQFAKLTRDKGWNGKRGLNTDGLKTDGLEYDRLKKGGPEN